MTESIRKCILLVEDEALLAMTEKMQLEEYGYTVRTVTTGEKAVETVKASSDLDLILMDINLGNGIDGTQAAEIILKDRDIPIVFLSSHTEPEIVEKTEKITSYGYVVKNSSVTVLDASIKMAFRLYEAHMELKRRKEDLETVSNNIPGGVVYQLIVDPRGNRRLAYVSSAVERLHGVTQAEALNDARVIYDQVHKEDIQRLIEAEDQAFKTLKPFSCEVRIRRSAGDVRWLQLQSAISKKPDGTIVADGIEIDITEHKQAEEATRKQHNFAESLIETAQTIILVLDMDGNVVQFNPYTEELLGYSLDEVKGMNWIETFIRPENGLNVRSVFRKTVDDNQTRANVNSIITKDGRTVLVEWRNKTLKDADGHTIGILATGTDITERKRAEEALHQERNLLLSIIDSIPDLIYVKNTEARKQIVNRADCLKCGFKSKEDLIGKDDFEIFPPEIAQPFFEDDQRVLKHGESVVNREEKLIMPNGETIWQLTTKLPMYDQEGNITGLVGIGHDITDRRLAEEEIQRQLTEKETLLREVHHRVKNNIANIESLLSLQAGSTAHAEVKAALQDTISRVQSTRVLYDKLLLSKDLDEISIKDYAESLVDSLVMVFDSGKNIIIEKHISEFVIEARKAFAIGIILNELLTNVFKYAFGDREDGVVSVSIEKEENEVTLIIQDNGCGFDERALKNESPGFGLTIVKMLVKQLQGAITFKNDNGTHTTLEFPITVEQ